MLTAGPSQGCAIVTGGGRGIGRAITLRLARTAPILVVGRTPDDLARVATEIKRGGGLAAYFAGDVADPDTASSAVELARRQGWWCRHLVCNAGIGRSGATETFDPSLWRRIIDVNVNGTFWFVRACLPDMLAQHQGVVTIISSLAGVHGVAFDAGYTASKHALVGLARALSAEFGRRGIAAAALCPSFIESEMTQRTIRGVMARRGLTEPEARQRVADKTPARRILSADELAEAVALLGTGDIAAALRLAEAGGYPIVSGRD
jgi:NAD(P)-dependent dehydrogenase (short-subunit alcohol dehydrogenase family)